MYFCLLSLLMHFLFLRFATFGKGALYVPVLLCIIIISTLYHNLVKIWKQKSVEKYEILTC